MQLNDILISRPEDDVRAEQPPCEHSSAHRLTYCLYNEVWGHLCCFLECSVVLFYLWLMQLQMSVELSYFWLHTHRFLFQIQTSSLQLQLPSSDVTVASGDITRGHLSALTELPLETQKASYMQQHFKRPANTLWCVKIEVLPFKMHFTTLLPPRVSCLSPRRLSDKVTHLFQTSCCRNDHIERKLSSGCFSSRTLWAASGSNTHTSSHV